MLKLIAQRFAAWRRFRDTVRELSSFSDRDLQDIGIHRADIAAVASDTDVLEHG